MNFLGTFLQRAHLDFDQNGAKAYSFGFGIPYGNQVRFVDLIINNLVKDGKDYWQMFILSGDKFGETDVLERPAFEEKLFTFLNKCGVVKSK